MSYPIKHLLHIWPRGVAWAVLAVLAAVGEAHAQGFGILTGRNHPELRWQVAETEHFRILYPAHLQGIEAEAAPIAEASYEALSQNLETEFDRRIDIYLSDEDEIANGFAVPIGRGHTNIWVRVPEFARSVTGAEKWLRFVIAHEVAHIFHYRKVFDRPRWLGYLLGDPLPRFWAEGIAQYETEEWTALRGDRWLRTAVLDDRLSYSDEQSLWNGRLLYAVGSSQVRYFADRYGDSTLTDVLEQRKPVLFGLARVHDFYDAFRDATGSSYRSFYDDWRRHVNVYYNTLASQLENVDSLGTEPLDLPGQYTFDIAYSPDTSHVAVLALTSLRRPVRRLFVVDRETDAVEIVAEGSIEAPVAWSPDGQRIAYSRLHRGRYGSLLRDLYLVDRDGSNRKPITANRRAGSPAFSPDGDRLAFSASDGGTENIYLLDLTTGSAEPLTRFSGDVQIASLRWHPDGRELLFNRFRPDGRRDVAVLNLATGRITSLTSGRHDDRNPVYGPDGSSIAYASLRDDVPNVFVHDRTTPRHERVTALAVGATVMDWLPADSLYPSGSLVISSAATKAADRAYRIDADRRTGEVQATVPPEYATWTRRRPPATIPPAIAPDADLVLSRYEYRSWRNLRHVASLAFPYASIGRNFDLRTAWGLAGLSAWVEPLGKHTVFLAGGISVPDPLRESFAVASYVNNQWHPSISLNLYRLPGAAQVYGDDLLVEAFAGGDLSMTWPLDWSDRPYSSHTLSARLRVVDVQALTTGSFVRAAVPPPEEGQQFDLRLALTWRKQRPYWNNIIHPLDGLGLRFQMTGAVRVMGTDTEYVRADVSAFGVFDGIGLHRLFLYGRAQAQRGDPFNQNFVGLSRHDAVRLTLPNEVPLLLGESERVRGYRRYALGDRMLFGTVEYRVPLASSMQTTLLGVASLGSLAGAVFADAGAVWTGGRPFGEVKRLGVGIELKNALRLAGIRLAHALGAAQPASSVGDRSNYEVYYRIRTTLPF